MASFYQTPGKVFRLREWDPLEWFEYGFGTRAAAPGGDGELVLLRQRHSNLCHRVDSLPGDPLQGDALLTATPGLLLGIRTADCLPILIADPVRRAVAAVHAGWRGTVAQVSSQAVKALSREFGSRPEDLEVAIGPGIGPCCYEVGGEVARRFGPWKLDVAYSSGPVALDLVEVNWLQLIGAGVRMESIHRDAPCTGCSAAEFYSYRREGAAAGRMLSVIGIRPR